MEYNLYPPFLVVPEEPSFDDAWEAFCCKMLMLMESRTDIIRRKPPESGIDLYCPATKTAYQCKSVESGQSSGLSAAKAITSFESAVKVRDQLGWETYVLCTNVDVTGAAETKLKSNSRSIVLRTRAYWIQACQKFPEQVRRNFRLLIKIPHAVTDAATGHEFSRIYAAEVGKLMGTSPVPLFLYSHQHDRVYTLPVSLHVKTGDLVRLLVRAFGLPKTLTRAEQGLKVRISHGLARDGVDLPPERTLQENDVIPRSVLLLTTRAQIDTPSGQFFTRSVNRELFSGTPRFAEEVESLCATAFSDAFASFDRTVADEATDRQAGEDWQ